MGELSLPSGAGGGMGGQEDAHSAGLVSEVVVAEDSHRGSKLLCGLGTAAERSRVLQGSCGRCWKGWKIGKSWPGSKETWWTLLESMMGLLSSVVDARSQHANQVHQLL